MEKENKKAKLGNLQKAILLRTILPMFLMGVVIAFFAAREIQRSVTDEIEKNVVSIASALSATYDEVYPGDYVLVGDELVSLYKGEQELTGQYAIIDRIKSTTGMEVSLFYGNTRILTTLRDADGNRYIATGVNEAVISALSKKYHPGLANADKALFYEVTVDDIAYYACYYPLFNSNGTVVGMIAVAKEKSTITSEIISAMVPMLIAAIICMVLAAFISIHYTKQMIVAITAIKHFLHRMTKGELNNEMSAAVIKREDEIGAAGKDIVEMQNAIRTLVEIDVLTGLYNRRFGGARFRKLQQQNLNSGVPFSVAIGDIDFFKKVNDTYGHDIGDLVLKQVAATMKNGMQGHGFVARWGGEEFLLIFDKEGQDQAEKTLWNILGSIRALNIDAGNGTVVHVTMTFGITDGSDAEDYGNLIKMADEKLYFGKEHGRNRVVTILEDGTENAVTVSAQSIEEVPPELLEAAKQVSGQSQTSYNTKVVDSLVEKMSAEIMKME